MNLSDRKKLISGLFRHLLTWRATSLALVVGVAACVPLQNAPQTPQSAEATIIDKDGASLKESNASNDALTAGKSFSEQHCAKPPTEAESACQLAACFITYFDDRQTREKLDACLDSVGDAVDARVAESKRPPPKAGKRKRRSVNWE